MNNNCRPYARPHFTRISIPGASVSDAVQTSISTLIKALYRVTSGMVIVCSSPFWLLPNIGDACISKNSNCVWPCEGDSAWKVKTQKELSNYLVHKLYPRNFYESLFAVWPTRARNSYCGLMFWRLSGFKGRNRLSISKGDRRQYLTSCCESLFSNATRVPIADPVKV